MKKTVLKFIYQMQYWTDHTNINFTIKVKNFLYFCYRRVKKESINNLSIIIQTLSTNKDTILISMKFISFIYICTQRDVIRYDNILMTPSG